MSFSAIISQLAEGMLMSFAIFILTLIGSIPLGLPLAFGRTSKNRLIKGFCSVYISYMRGTPLILQLIVVYFGPWFIFKIPLSADYRFWAVIIAFVLNYAGYFAEIYRSGIEAINPGQWEASFALGLNKTQAFSNIILPQVIKIVLPSITNEVITLIKDTSIAFSIGILEMFTIAKQIASAEKSMIPFIAAGLFYYIFNAVVAWIMAKAENAFSFELC